MDNPKALKHLISKTVVDKISASISDVYPAFDSKKFRKVSSELSELELKDRVLVITKQLKATLPSDYKESAHILMESIKKEDLSGFELWPYSEYISQFGLDHFDLSMKAMYILTQKFTAEFAVRSFLIKDHRKVLKYFEKWVFDKNVHIRRWVSEGTRPLLPWGQKLPLFIMDPVHTLLLLDKLKFDPELYVRKSVANHLNDISKNHPQVVIDMLRMWKKDVPREHVDKLQWIIRHSLRTLIKKGHPGALKLLGVEGKAEISVTQIKLNKKKFSLNDDLIFSFEIDSQSKQKLIIDYMIDFQKANGSKGKKIFKLKTLDAGEGEKIQIKRKHSLKAITTMKFYPGIHHLYIQVNGHIVQEVTFHFTP